MTKLSNTKIIIPILLGLVVVAAAGWFFSAKKKPDSDAADNSSSAFGEGIHYRTLKSPLSSTATKTADGKISVVEFFWYGCPHCQSFEPSVRQWLKTIPEDVAFQQIPVAWNEATKLHAALFYIAVDADNTNQLHDKLFERIIELRPERNLAAQLEQLAGVYTAHGIDENIVKGLIESAQVQDGVASSEKIMRQAEVSSTPTVLVDGRWAVRNNEEVGQAGIFNVVDFLVQKARNAK